MHQNMMDGFRLMSCPWKNFLTTPQHYDTITAIRSIYRLVWLTMYLALAIVFVVVIVVKYTMYMLGFVSCIDQLFDEELLIGTGWTTRETVR